VIVCAERLPDKLLIPPTWIPSCFTSCTSHGRTGRGPDHTFAGPGFPRWSLAWPEHTPSFDGPSQGSRNGSSKEA